MEAFGGVKILSKKSREMLKISTLEGVRRIGQSVTAPLLAVLTCFAYLAKTPRV